MIRMSLRSMALPVQMALPMGNIIKKFALSDWKPNPRKVKGAPHVMSSPQSAKIHRPIAG
jgi:hypothetical protein